MSQVSEELASTRPLRRSWWFRRLAALLVDWLSCVLIASVLLPFDSELLPLAVFGVSQVLLVGTIGHSVGHRLFGLHVERPDASPAGPVAALIRTALLLLVIPAVLTDGDGVGLHDRAAGTHVVRR